MKITTKNRFASTAVVALSHLLHTNFNAILFFLPSCCKGLYISSGDLMDCRVIHICYLPNGLLLSASLYSVSFRRALHSSSSGVTSGGMSPSITWIFFCKIKLFHSFRCLYTVEPPIRGHPRDQGYVSACGRLKNKTGALGHTMHQTCLLELLRSLVIVLSTTGLLDVAFYT